MDIGAPSMKDSKNKLSIMEGILPPPLTSPRSAVIFVEKAAAACAAPALK